MASEQFLKAQFGKQAAFGTPVAAEAQWPGQGEYQDATEVHSAPFDSGNWTPTSIIAKVADYATFSVKGTAFYELLPVLLNAGFAVDAPEGANPYDFAYVVNPAAVGAPAPYTWLLGGGGDLGATGPAVKIQDAYCESFQLSGNMNSKEVQLEASWFGLSVNDNSGAGFDFGAVGLPAGLQMLKTLHGAISLGDATTTGGAAVLTALTGKRLDWTLKVTTGVQPLWSSDSGVLTYTGVKFGPPSIEHTATIRTDSTTYAAIQAKKAALTYQEMLIGNSIMSGEVATREFTAKLCGRWTASPSAHQRENGEIVMKATFTAETPYTQTTTPLYTQFAVRSGWNHGAA